MRTKPGELPDTPGGLNAHWAELRPAVFGVAYRLLGSVADAEDVAHDVWLRAAAADLDTVGDLQAWLVTVAARRSYDILRSARLRREIYVGPWLPEPLLTGPDASEPVIVDHVVAAARDFLPHASRAERERPLRTFKCAYERGEFAELVALLDPDVVYMTDGGGQVFAARKPIVGGERVAEVMIRVGRQWRPDRIDLIEVGGELALRFHRGGGVFSVDTVDLRGGLIVAYRRVMNPNKLLHV